jgi:CheY-like chemotaxis protein/signal transduction histidine kinase
VPAENLLVVDDDQAFLDLMVHHLRRKGYNVECALDGKEALHLLQSKGQFDVLITDLMMPGMSGLELLRLAKKLDPSIEVIVITAAPSLEMAISAMREDGAFDYLTKPLDMMGELSLAVERAADHRRMKIEKDHLRERLLHGADKFRLVLENTDASILAVDDNNKVIVASADFIGQLEDDSQEDELDVSQMPEKILDYVSQWQDLGCPKSANVEITWPNSVVRVLSIAPIPGGECLQSGWVMMLHETTSLKRIESYLQGKIIGMEQSFRSPMIAAASMLNEMESHFAINGTQMGEKVTAIKNYIEKLVDKSAELNIFDNDIQIENNTRIPLPEFISREQERLTNEFGVVNQFRIEWDLKSDLPQVKVDLQLMYQILQHLTQWARNVGGQSDSVNVSCWNKNNRIWFRIYGMKTAPETANAKDEVDQLQEKMRMELAEVHLAFAKSFVNSIEGQIWKWNDENEGENVAFFVPIV